MFEIVHTVDDWYDGPRKGIADYGGQPHLFESEWRDRENLDADTFLLAPVDSETFNLALEDWAIWRRWEAAFHQGTAAKKTHPALVEDRERHEELESTFETSARRRSGPDGSEKGRIPGQKRPGMERLWMASARGPVEGPVLTARPHGLHTTKLASSWQSRK